MVIALSYLIIILITTGYAFILAFQVRGKPDQVAISHFAEMLGRWLMHLLEIFLTFFVALISTKKIGKDISLNGFIMGILAGMFGVVLEFAYGSQFNYRAVLLFLIMAGFGFLGGFFTQKRIEKKMKSPA
jgi:hypothetical protein